MGFDASNIIEKLDYDFRPYVNASGTIPEPTTAQITDFQFGARDLANKSGAAPEGDPDNRDAQRELLGIIQELSREDLLESFEDMNKLIAKLTSGRPSYDDLNALQEKSFRHWRAFLGWLMGEIMDPEESSVVTKLSQAARNGASTTLRSVKS